MRKVILKSVLATLAVLLVLFGYGVICFYFPLVGLITSGLFVLFAIFKLFYERFKNLK
jgi:hypothetical protein